MRYRAGESNIQHLFALTLLVRSTGTHKLVVTTPHADTQHNMHTHLTLSFNHPTHHHHNDHPHATHNTHTRSPEVCVHRSTLDAADVGPSHLALCLSEGLLQLSIAGGNLGVPYEARQQVNTVYCWVAGQSLGQLNNVLNLVLFGVVWDERTGGRGVGKGCVGTWNAHRMQLVARCAAT